MRKQTNMKLDASNVWCMDDSISLNYIFAFMTCLAHVKLNEIEEK